MATLQEFQKNNQKVNAKNAQKNKEKGNDKKANKIASPTVKTKKTGGVSRRPYKDTYALKTEEQNMETAQFDNVTTENTKSETHESSSPGETPKKVEISFYGSEILRAKWQKPFTVAEKVATDWVYGGNFENLDIGIPVADELATRGLKKAKEVEKQVLESPAFEKVAVKALTWGMKLNQEVQNIRSQVKSKFGK